jgi:hypothetical protein
VLFAFYVVFLCPFYNLAKFVEDTYNMDRYILHETDILHTRCNTLPLYYNIQTWNLFLYIHFDRASRNAVYVDLKDHKSNVIPCCEGESIVVHLERVCHIFIEFDVLKLSTNSIVVIARHISERRQSEKSHRKSIRRSCAGVLRIGTLLLLL